MKNGIKKHQIVRVEPVRDLQKVKAIKKMLRASPRDYLLWTLGCNCGLRCIDLLRLKVGQFIGKQLDDIVEVRERKTMRKKRIDKDTGKVLPPKPGKVNEIVVNSSILEAFKYFMEQVKPGPDEYLFKSQRGDNERLTSGAAGRKIKHWCIDVGNTERCGANTMRKTWAYHQIVTYGQPLPRVTAALNHADGATTLRYCGAGKDEVQT